MRVAKWLGIDPAIVLTETNPDLQAARYAAAQVMYQDEREANK